MQLTLTDDSKAYTIKTIEHIEHVGEFDGEVWTPCEELLYGFHISGHGFDYNSLDDYDGIGYQCWPTDDEAILAGLAQLQAMLKQQRRAERNAA